MRFASARNWLKRAMRRGSRKRVAVAREAQRVGDWQAAEHFWRRVLANEPTRVGAWIQLGNMLNEQARRDEAIAAFERAERIDPASPLPHAGIAGVHERAGRWRDAETAWTEAIDRFERQTGRGDGPVSKDLLHAYQHAALSARSAGAPKRARAILNRAFPASLRDGHHLTTIPLRVSVLAPDDDAEAIAILDDLLASFSDAAPAARSLLDGLGPTDLRTALVTIAPALLPEAAATSLVGSIAEVYEHLKLWRELQTLHERAYALDRCQPNHLQQALKAAARRLHLADARRLAREAVRANSDLLPLHILMTVYEDAGEFRHAFLICRYLTRRWGHSHWHRAHLITLAARVLGLNAADRLTRSLVSDGGYDEHAERAYCRSAFLARHYGETVRRIRTAGRVAKEDDIQALLGYAIANDEGIAAAELYFREFASASLQSLPALVGIVHMQQRQRNFAGALDQWRRIAFLYPGEAHAAVESARSLYELRDQVGALNSAARSLASTPRDATMSEFFAWLLVVNGHYARAWKQIGEAHALTGPSWTLVDLGVQCCTQLGQLDASWPVISAYVPSGDTPEDSKRLYSAVRSLVASGRADLIVSLVDTAAVNPNLLAWLHPYAEAAAAGSRRARQTIRTTWERRATMVGETTKKTIEAMSDDAIESLLGRARDAQPLVHIVNKFEQPRGGSELHALDLAEQIGRYTSVQLWAPENPHPSFSSNLLVRGIDLSSRIVPRGGTIVLIGIYFDIGWIRASAPERVIVLYNTFEAPSLHQRLQEVMELTGIKTELLFCSNMMGAECGFRGLFEPSPTDLTVFSPVVRAADTPRPFTLGRHSRDVAEKHHADDWKVYQRVSEHGGRSLVLGGSCMRQAYPALPGLELQPARNTGIPAFLQDLDAYYYRTSTWIEPWGRVVVEAMACGLPVLVHRAGGYAEIVSHGENGFVFDQTEEAVELVTRLMADPDLRSHLGGSARRTVEELLSPSALRRLSAFYLLRSERPAEIAAAPSGLP